MCVWGGGGGGGDILINNWWASAQSTDIETGKRKTATTKTSRLCLDSPVTLKMESQSVNRVIS